MAAAGLAQSDDADEANAYVAPVEEVKPEKGKHRKGHKKHRRRSSTRRRSAPEVLDKHPPMRAPAPDLVPRHHRSSITRRRSSMDAAAVVLATETGVSFAGPGAGARAGAGGDSAAGGNGTTVVAHPRHLANAGRTPVPSPAPSRGVSFRTDAAEQEPSLAAPGPHAVSWVDPAAAAGPQDGVLVSAAPFAGDAEPLTKLLRTTMAVPALNMAVEHPRYFDKVPPPRGPVSELNSLQVVQLVLEQTKMAVAPSGISSGGVPGTALRPAWFGGMEQVPCLLCSAPVLEAPESGPGVRQARIFNGFCAQCDQYAYRCVADAFGYRFAGVVLEAAAAMPPAVDQIKREEEVVLALQRSRGFTGRLPARRFLFDSAIYHVLVDTATKSVFYYDSATGEATWKAPPGMAVRQ